MSDVLDVLREYAKDWRDRAGDVGPVHKAISEIERLKASNRDWERTSIEFGDKLTATSDALRELVRTANVLLQNAMGCAVNHHGVDFSIHGMPGWISDCQSSIQAADAALSALAEEPAGPSEADKLRVERDNAIDLLMSIAARLELPRSEGGPPDHMSVYENAIDQLERLHADEHERRLRAEKTHARPAGSASAVADDRQQQLRIQALGAALSRRDWHATERAYEEIRDDFDKQKHCTPTVKVSGDAAYIQVHSKPVGWFNPWNDYHGYQQVAEEFEGKPGQIPLYSTEPPEALEAAKTAPNPEGRS